MSGPPAVGVVYDSLGSIAAIQVKNLLTICSLYDISGVVFYPEEPIRFLGLLFRPPTANFL